MLIAQSDCLVDVKQDEKSFNFSHIRLSGFFYISLFCFKLLNIKILIHVLHPIFILDLFCLDWEKRYSSSIVCLINIYDELISASVDISSLYLCNHHRCLLIHSSTSVYLSFPVLCVYKFSLHTNGDFR